MMAAPGRLPTGYASDAQRRGADPSSSVWVAANAGTGKTKVLTDRVLRLLLGGTAPERLLCLTFTRAAAAEMAIRVNGVLGRWTLIADEALDGELGALTGGEPGESLRARARRLFAAVLDAPGGLRILTIHAFCQSLLGRFPVEARIAPHFELLDERGAAELMMAAQESVLAQAHAGGDEELADALAEIARHTTDDGFADLMDMLRAARGRLRAALSAHGGIDALAGAIHARLGATRGTGTAEIVAEACGNAAFDRAALAAACRALEQGTGKDRERSARIAAWTGAAPEARAALYEDYRRVFITGSGTPAAVTNLATKGAQAADGDALDTLLAEQARILAVDERCNAVVVARASEALLRLGGAMLDDYERHKTARARLDYDDLIRRTAELLGRPGVAPWVLYKLDGGLDHILVDEAQDTSPDQWRVIAALTDEFFAGEGARDEARTVFMVGDEKQSIFSFQGADLAELARMRRHFETHVRDAGREWDEIGLERSFRSTAPVLQAVDAVFARTEARDGVAFADHAIRHQPERKGHAGTVELWPLVAPATAVEDVPWTPPVTRRESDRPSARLAAHMARTIAGWIETGEALAARGRPIRAGDVLVLVQRRGVFVGELARAFKARGVPVAGSDRMVLSEQLAVMDLAALGEFLLLPGDDLTLATVLKGPLIGLDEDALFALAYDRADSLWRTLVRRRAERPDFARAHDALGALLARADYVPPYELFADVLGAGAGREKLAARLGHDANDPIDEFLALALDYQRSEPPSLQGFLRWLSVGGVEVKRDFDQGRDEVRVMTVHGAKGLQAPIVFLPDTTRIPQPRAPQLLWHGEGEDTIPLWPPKTRYDVADCVEAREDKRGREMAEYRRLFYVAMTRAEDRLYICGWQTRNKAPGDCWYRLAEAGLADVAKEFSFDAGEHGWSGKGLRLDARQTREARPDEALRTPPARAEAPAFARTPPAREPAPPRPLAPSRPAIAEPGVLSPLSGGDDDARFRRGRLIHLLLQVLPDLAHAAREPAARRYLARPGHGLGREAQDEIAGAVLGVLREPAFADIFGADSRAEVPLAGVVDGAVVSGQIDRLLVRDDRVMVVDFKSNRPAPARPEDVPEAYIAQMAAYRALLAGIFPDRPIDCALLWTDGPRLMPLDG